MTLRQKIKFICAIILVGGQMSGQVQLLDNFVSGVGEVGSTPPSWSHMTGDGEAEMTFLQQDGFAQIHVDATKDTRNIWWAVIRRELPEVDIEKLMEPGMELRVEARISSSHAPRRVNLHFNHQRTTDYHSHLMEYDIPEAGKWHTISMTTRDFNVHPGDSVAAQLALMDWGREKYKVEIDSFKVSIVPFDSVGDDLGNPVPYHPPVPDTEVFQYQLATSDDALVDNQLTMLHWDLAAFRDRQICGSALLELTFISVEGASAVPEELRQVRVVEIYKDGTLNDQMVIDSELPEEGNGTVLYTINAQVLERMIQGRTQGLAIYPLGDFQVTFQTNKGPNQPLLYLGLSK